MWRRSDLRPADVDVAGLYDGFSILTLLWLEALGFCGPGEGGAFVEGGRAITLGGRLPLNTNGGQLSGGRLHGLGFVHEVCLQLRGQAGERQVDGRGWERSQWVRCLTSAACSCGRPDRGRTPAGRALGALPYRRSVGGAEARFLARARGSRVWGQPGCGGAGVRSAGRPTTPRAARRALRSCAWPSTGWCESWSWVAAPGPEHPAERPFAFALVQLDGADTALLHMVEVGEEADMTTGMRVRARWRPERTGSILDVAAFVPASAAPTPRRRPRAEDRGAGRRPGTRGRRPTGCSATPTSPGGRCRGSSRGWPTAGSRGPVPVLRRRVRATAPAVPDLSRRCVGGGRTRRPGRRDRYTVVHVPFQEMTVDLPFVAAWIRLDGADVPFPHLLAEAAPDEVRVGQRVEAVWAPEVPGPSWECIRHFRPVAPGPADALTS